MNRVRTARAGFVAVLWSVLLCLAGGCASKVVAPADSPATVDTVTLNLWHDKQDLLQDAALPNQAQVLASRLGYQYRFFSADASSQARRYGNAILVRGTIEASREVKLAPLDDYRNAGWVRTTIDGRPLNVYVTHLHHTPEGGAIRAEQIAGVLTLIGEKAGDAPSIIGGDFNARSDMPELAPLRARFAEAYSDAHPGVDANAPVHATLNPHLGHAPIRIDHVFAQRDAFRVVDADIILDQPDATGAWPSDHYGVWVRLMYSEVPRR